VGGGGPGNYSTIQEAIDNASSGNTVFVYAGTYYENIDIDKSLTLSGEDRDSTIINGSEDDHTVYIQADFVKIENFTINNIAKFLYWGNASIYLLQSQYCSILNNNISSDNGTGIILHLSHYSKILNNNIFDSHRGIYSSTSNYCNISYNTIANTEERGLTLEFNKYDEIIGNKFTNNGIVLLADNTGLKTYINSHIITNDNLVNNKPLLYYKNSNGININGITVGQLILANCTNINVKNLDVSNTDVGMYIGYSSDIFISDNNVTNTNLYAVYLFGSSTITFTNNKVNFNELDALRLEFASNNNITNNNLSSNYRYGMTNQMSSNNLIASNEISDEYVGIGISRSSNTVIKGNNFSAIKYGALNLYGDAYQPSYNNVITQNNFIENGIGVLINKSTFENSQYIKNNRIFHNNFINNAQQAIDYTNTNFWNDAYPFGGNYWNDWTTPDNYYGPNQNLSGSDGFVDNPYNILGPANSNDFLPFTSPISMTNQPPVADAGPDQNAAINQIVYFNGSDSYDIDGDILFYKWDFGDGTSTDWQIDYNTSHSYSQIGNFTINLTVSDRMVVDLDSCIIHVINQAPVADAGLDENTTVNQTLYFDGSGSYDPDNDPLTYNWDFGDGGSTGWQSNSNSSHSYNTPGNYTVTLYVNDSEFTDSDTCIVQVSGNWVGNHPPSITIIEPDGVDDYADVSYIITWDDFDPDDNAIIELYYDTDNSCFNGVLIVEDIDENDASNYYAWDTNTIPEDSYYIYAHINDGISDPGYDYSEGPITVIHSGINYAPIANAGSDQTTTVGQVVNFDGSGSYDPDEDPLTFKWDFGDDTSSGWQNDWTATHTYEQPNNYFVTLTVSDGSLTDEDTCIIYVADITGNHAPMADAGPDQTVKIKQTVHFDGSNSYDIDEDILTYKWEFGDGSVTSWQSDCNTSHLYTKAGNYITTLTVDDGELSDTDTCVIFVTDEDVDISGNDTDGDGLPDDWELEHGLDPENPDDALLDADGDTLTNLEEFEYGTDPNNEDTDSDSIADGWEIEYGLVPTDANDALSDFDGDSLSNLIEFELGTNPNDKDTDGDGYTDNIDDYPTNADKYKKQVTDDNAIIETFTIIFIGMIILIILILMAAVIYKNKRKMGDQDLGSAKQFAGRHEVGDSSTAQELQPPEDLELESDKIIDDLKTEALSPRKPSSLDLSNEEMLTQFEEKRRDGKISD
ncbi:MAG: PKD domain-containing protein, partial [Thermoplasmata archaeon]|nr:PKD domain-containing protein [Thermoplasmata archaeon]